MGGMIIATAFLKRHICYKLPAIPHNAFWETTICESIFARDLHAGAAI
jgi:hypothetical protein